MGTFKNPSIAALQSRSRFCEGSMNDRASAAPPVHFLGPEALAALEQPVPLPASGSGSSFGNPRASQDTGSSSNCGGGSGAGGGGGFSQTWSRKTGSRLFGQVWEGMRDKLRLRKDDNGSHGSSKTPAAVISAAKTTTAVTTTTAEHIPIFTDPAERDGPPASRTRSKLAPPAAAAAAAIAIPSSAATTADFQFTGFQTARPSRDEVLASYQQLMAGGFFQAHAIQSSRHGLARPPQPPSTPGTSLPAPSTSMRPATARVASPPPQWPLASPLHTTTAVLQSPTSVSSRGTKRAAVNESESDDESMQQDDDDDDAGVYDKENQAPLHPNTVHDKKRLRRSVSRESLFLPKIRSSSSSASRRSLSAASHAIMPPASNKLQKRRPHAARYQDNQQQQQYARAVSRPRHVSDGGGSARVLRGRAAVEANRSMRVVPDEGRGIPSVPAIPAKFTYGEDRQNDGPWRGLRVR